MSQDASLDTRESGPAYARCKKRADGNYDRVYIGKQRGPSLPDEQDAVAVIECIYGGRVRLYDDGDGWMRVEYDPAWGASRT